MLILIINDAPPVLLLLHTHVCGGCVEKKTIIVITLMRMLRREINLLRAHKAFSPPSESLLGNSILVIIAAVVRSVRASPGQVERSDSEICARASTVPVD
jgi:hypothetical protein